MDTSHRFQLWEFHVSHGTALIRSPRSGDEVHNTDIMFFGVEYLALPRHLGPIAVEEGTPEDLAIAERAIGPIKEPSRVWVVCCGAKRHLVVAAKVEVRETSTDIFDSPFS
jgi:hypothetical protein